jgi:hypothetical protein
MKFSDMLGTFDVVQSGEHEAVVAGCFPMEFHQQQK